MDMDNHYAFSPPRIMPQGGLGAMLTPNLMGHMPIEPIH